MYDLLKGLRVVEGAAFIASPSAGLYLAQLGAEVIRFDSIGGGPDFRRWPLADNGASLYWEGLNKAKKSIAIDLTQPAGRELAQRLAAAPGPQGGVFLTNFPAEGFLSYERLKALREDLICCRVMGWADGGPAVDYTINAAVGVPLMTGPAASCEPVNHVLPAWDLLTGAYAAFALLAAVMERNATGRGREIRISLSDIAATSLANLGLVSETLLAGRQRERMGNDLFGAFGRDFVTRDGERLMVVAITPRQWVGLIEGLALGDAVKSLEAEVGASFAEDEGHRFRHRDRLFPLFEDAIARRTTAELALAFDAASVCWSRYQPLERALDDPRLFRDNPVFDVVRHPSGVSYPTPGPAAVIPQDPRRAPAAAPRLGANTDEILAEVLGLPEAEIARLHDAGVVASA